MTSGSEAARIGFVQNVIFHAITWRHSGMQHPATIAWKQPILDTQKEKPQDWPWWPGYAEISRGGVREVAFGDLPGFGLKQYITDTASLRLVDITTIFDLWLVGSIQAPDFELLAEWVYTVTTTIEVRKDPPRRGEQVSAKLRSTDVRGEPEGRFDTRIVGEIEEYIPAKRRPIVKGPVAVVAINEWIAKEIRPQIFVPR